MSKKGQFKILYALSFAWQLGFLIAAPLTILILLGFWLDQIFHTSPMLVISGVIGGIAINIYEVYSYLVPLISKNEKHD